MSIVTEVLVQCLLFFFCVFFLFLVKPSLYKGQGIDEDKLSKELRIEKLQDTEPKKE